MDFAPAPSRGIAVGLALVAAACGAALALALSALRVGPGPVAALLAVLVVLLLPVIGRLAVWLWGVVSLRYAVSRDGVVIQWGPTRQVIPMAEITHLLNGRPYAAPLTGLRWPGHEVGRTAIATDDGAPHTALVFATRGPAEQLLVVTPGLVYAISPADRSAFVAEFTLRSRLGPVQQLTHGTDRRAWAGLSIWRDGLALRLALVALVLNLLAFAWLLWQYPSLPAALPLQLSYDAALQRSVPDAPRPRAWAWLLPLIGLAAIGANGLLAVSIHRRVRLAALLLLAGALLLQLALAVVIGQVT
jgi:hypothetical protein